MSQKTLTIRIARNGVLRAIHDDALVPLLRQGDVSIRRASHVEPDTTKPGYWYADMAPVGGPVLRGYETRTAALHAEVQYLTANGIPVPESE